MNGLPREAGALAASIAAVTDEPSVARVICPPYVSLAAVRDALAGTGVQVGAQNIHAEAGGAYTGEISGAMLDGLAAWCIVGHSERRRDQLESDELIGRKILRCADANLRAILCVGEQLAERESGKAESTVKAQLEAALGVVLAKGPIPADLVVAYEPVWAIGTGRTATTADIAASHAAIGKRVDQLSPRGEPVPILYGGSVKPENAKEIMAVPEVAGVLVGGASLDAAGFWAIYQAGGGA